MYFPMSDPSTFHFNKWSWSQVYRSLLKTSLLSFLFKMVAVLCISTLDMCTIFVFILYRLNNWTNLKSQKKKRTFVKNQKIYNILCNNCNAIWLQLFYKMVDNRMYTTGCKLYKQHILNLWTKTDKQNWVAALIVFKWRWGKEGVGLQNFKSNSLVILKAFKRKKTRGKEKY